VEETNLQQERTVFFSDVVIAIAITLLALELKVEPINGYELCFADILNQWQSFVAFLLSFINIAIFWKIHHAFFDHIKTVDSRMLLYNFIWLFFIVLVPFSTSLFGHHLFNKVAVIIYSINILFVSIFQNFLWDYASKLNDYKKVVIKDSFFQSELHKFCTLDIINSFLALFLSFINPILAFVILYTKFPILLLLLLFYRKKEV